MVEDLLIIGTGSRCFVYESANVHRTRTMSRGPRFVELDQLQLARAAKIGTATLKRFEVGRQNPIPNNMVAIRIVLEDAGSKFIDRGKGGGPGVGSRE